MNQPLRDFALSHLPIGATFDNLVEMALTHDCTHAGSKQVVAKEEAKPDSSARRKGNGKDKKKGKKTRIQCRRCGFWGHIERDCQRELSKIKCYM